MALDPSLPKPPSPFELTSAPGALPPSAWQAPPPPASGGFSARRYLSAFRRYKWLLAASLLLASGAAYGAFRFVTPDYVSSGTIWVSQSSDDDAAPVRTGNLLDSYAWVQLLRSGTVLDTVALQQRLFIRHAPEDGDLLHNFNVGDRFYGGDLVFEVSSDGSRYFLRDARGLTLETAPIGNPVGAELGYHWLPPSEQLTPGRIAEFTVVQARDAVRDMDDGLVPTMDQAGNWINVSYRGKDAQQVAAILTAVMERFVDVAARLKAGRLTALTEVLREQLTTVEQQLRTAQTQLSEFRVRTITQPREQAAPIAAGLVQTQTPVMADYFQKRLDLDALQRDRERLAEALVTSSGADGKINVTAFQMIPRVQTTSALTAALGELATKEVELRGLLERYTDTNQQVVQLKEEIRKLKEETILPTARSIDATLANEERGLEAALAARGKELSEIPPREIQEARLNREVELNSDMYADLNARYETAKLAEASSVPDVSILDRPTVPQFPANDQRLRFMAMAFMAIFGAAVACVILLDRIDPRVRHLSDVPEKMGLDIVGAIPRVGRLRSNGRQKNVEEAREAFRELRMRIQYGYGASKPMLLAVTSPAKGEGKTFVAANLAIAFSEMGIRTLLVDGDTRQGNLHNMLQRDRKPGLTDALTGLEEGRIVQGTDHANLYFMGFGSRNANSPELLNSTRMQELLSLAKRHYDLILFDCPPLGAGSDAFILGAHTGNVIIVLRTGATNKEFAVAKLEPFYRLPVRILGAVINDVDPSSTYGQYRYYSTYLPGYRAVGENGKANGVSAIALAGEESKEGE